MRKFVLAALAGVVLSLTACTPTTADGDPVSSTSTLEGDSAYYPNVGSLPVPTRSATPHLPTGVPHYVRCPGHPKTLRECFRIKK